MGGVDGQFTTILYTMAIIWHSGIINGGIIWFLMTILLWQLF